MSAPYQGKKVLFHTLGCKLNFAESSSIEKQLLEEGFLKTEKDENPDVCIINTCSVTEVADRKDRQAIKQIITKYPNAFIVVIGCYAQLKPETIENIEGVDLILGMQNKFDISMHLHNLQKTGETQIVHTERSSIDKFFPSCTRGDRTRYWLKVQDGCDNFCTYCTVPIARGKSRNDTVQNTVAQAQKAVIWEQKRLSSPASTSEISENPQEKTFSNSSKDWTRSKAIFAIVSPLSNPIC